MAARAPSRVWSIPAGAPFLPTLADALLGGGLVSVPRDDPLALADLTVLLPTRRSVRAFRDVLADRLGGDAAILPVIRPIGDVDEEDSLLDPLAETGGDRLAVPPAVAPLTRRLTLTRLILAWAKALRRHPLGLIPDEPLRIPASAADAAWLASDLARLVDDVATANVPWSALETLVPEDHAEYFQLTLRFLRIVSEQWPAYLNEARRADPAARRDRLLRSAANRIETHGSPGPIVAAGSTGSIPATAALLAAIARQPNGTVVLPGLDRDLDQAGWDAIGADDDGPASTHGHPQYGLKQLIGALGIAREAVVPLGDGAPVAARTHLLSEAIRPAATLEAWAALARGPGDALAGVDAIVARNEHEEATAIALAIREAIERGEASAALVTPDRTLARRVAVELQRWRLAVDDSAGTPLAETPHGVFARLLIEAASSDGDPVALLALLKHPFAAFGLPPDACRQAARTLELALFRGHRVIGGVAALAAALDRARAERDGGERVHVVRKRLSREQWGFAADLVARLTDCLGSLETAIGAGRTITAAEAATLVIDALDKAARDENGDTRLWEGEGGAALSGLLSGLGGDPAASDLELPAGDLPRFLAALMADVAVQPPPGGDPRVHIWGALEGRLQSVDCLILGGLDEGVWPTETRTDPWMSRAMRAAIGLPPPERRLGLAAHDFFQGMAAPRVIVTRAEKRGGAPTVESRWLQRLRALVGKDASDALDARGARWLSLARALDAAPGKPEPVDRPEPKPPLATRPTRLSVTEIETLIRDPYAIYARRILKLEPLDPLGRAPDRALRGTLMHEALGTFVAGWHGQFDAAAEAALVAAGRTVLAGIEDFPDVHALWALRFTEIARWFIAWEAARDANVAARHPEIDGALEIATQAGVFTLSGRADRIDEMKGDALAIYDFKTGTPQTQKTVFAGLTPQMTLEAAMARAGSFEGITAGKSVEELAWLAIGKAGRQEVYVPVAARGDPNDLADRAKAMLTALVAKFADPANGYVSRARPMMTESRFKSDYDHLARVREWALVESADDARGAGAMP